MLSLKNKNLHCDIKYIEAEGTTWFRAATVGKALGYANIRDAIRGLDEEDKDKLKNLVGSKMETTLTYNEKIATYINKAGLTAILVKSRLPNASVLAKEFDIDVHSHKYECKESETIGAIMKVFKGEKMKTQYNVLNYSIDLYFPDYDLVIECDENNHDDRDPKYEKRRQRRITKKLKCQWLRFDPDSEDFNIFQTVNQIFTVIKTKLI